MFPGRVWSQIWSNERAWPADRSLAGWGEAAAAASIPPPRHTATSRLTDQVTPSRLSADQRTGGMG
jgi:hypothetical protein